MARKPKDPTQTRPTRKASDRDPLAADDAPTRDLAVTPAKVLGRIRGWCTRGWRGHDAGRQSRRGSRHRHRHGDGDSQAASS